MIKIKYDIGGGEIVNTWAKITRLPGGVYRMDFGDLVSFGYCILHPFKRYFLGI